MLRGHALLLGCLSTGCGRDYVLSAQKPELEVNVATVEAPLTPVGEVAAVPIELRHVSGPTATLFAVDVQPILGDAFAVADAFPILLEPDASITLQAQFTPLTPGVSLSRLSVVSNAEVPRLDIDLRGQAGEYAAQVWPIRLDYGRVDTTATRTLYLENTGDLMISLESIGFGDAGDTLSTALPLPAAVAAGETLAVPVIATGALPVVDTITLTLDHATVPPVTIVANSCEYGNPADFDQDGDGVATCAGDCDDEAAAVFPGATETANGADEDCDGVIDEGTTAFDDDRDGYSEAEGDCDDTDPGAYPGALESTNGRDDDCDGVAL